MSQSVDAVVIGASAGGVEALNAIFSSISEPLPVPTLVVLHIAPHGSIIVDAFGGNKLRIKEAEDKEVLVPGTIYFAAPGYHLLVEKNRSLSLSVEEPVQYSRPSIDVLFESAGAVFGEHLLGILLTGANEDGAKGLFSIHKKGGHTLVQDPSEALSPTMPDSALKLFQPTAVLSLSEIGAYLSRLYSESWHKIEAKNE